MFSGFVETSGSRIIKNSTVLGAYFVVEVGLTFFFTLILARFLGAFEFGRISFALSYALVTSVVADAGLTFSLAKLIPRARAEAGDSIGGAFTLRLVFTSLVLLASGVLFWFFPYMRANLGLLLLILLSEHIRSFAVMVCFVFRGFQQMIYEPLILGSERVLLLVGAYLLLSSGYGVNSIALLYLCARGFSLAVALTLLFRKVGGLRLGIESEFARIRGVDAGRRLRVRLGLHRPLARYFGLRPVADHRRLGVGLRRHRRGRRSGCGSDFGV